ncbi:MAG: sodium-dependent transporter [Clostridiales bacterium]|nr:sodium-dependent transporter [Clostridiales bacterium]MCF8022759.1 sodium-dependent transporter [Clostridiales bacterium]
MYQRENWASRVGFILAAAGSAIGLGNIWRFPYMVGENGGAAFLFIYLIAIILIGYPTIVNEMIIGRKTHLNPVGAFKSIAPGAPWWLVGAMGVFSGFLILSYYSVVGGWSLAYIYKTVIGVLNVGASEFDTLFANHITNPIEPIIWHGIFMALTTSIVAAGIVKGIQRSVQVLMPLLFIILVLLMARAVTLQGAGEGLAFLLKPDFSEITSSTFLDAISQAFFTLSLGMGCMITYGSYIRDKDEIPGSAASVIGLDTLVAVMAGFAIFPAVFALGFTPNAGPGLTFITLPAVFSKIPLGIFFGFLFFALLTVAALTSAFSLLEVVVAWLIDEYKWSRTKATITLGILIFLAGIPSSLGYSTLSSFSFLGMDVLDTYDWLTNSILLPFGGLLTAIFTGYIWGTKNAIKEGNKNNPKILLGSWWSFLIRYVIPAVIFIIMLAGIWDTFK